MPSQSTPPPREFRISVDDIHITDAWNRRSGANPPTPVLLALFDQTRFEALSWVDDNVVELVEYWWVRKFRYAVPPELRTYLAEWARGVRVQPVAFTLVLIPDDGPRTPGNGLPPK